MLLEKKTTDTRGSSRIICRRYLMVSLFVWAILFALCYQHIDRIYRWLIEPHLPKHAIWIATRITASWWSNIKLCLWVSGLVSSVFWVFQWFWFIKPGLYPREARLLKWFLAGFSILLWLGILGCQWSLQAWVHFFLSELPSQVRTMLDISDFIDFFFKAHVYFMVMMQVPLLFYMLAYFNIEYSARITLCVCLVLSLVVVPADLTLQLFSTLFMYGLCRLGYYCGRRFFV